jgi:hypothetical protein
MTRTPLPVEVFIKRLVVSIGRASRLDEIRKLVDPHTTKERAIADKLTPELRAKLAAACDKLAKEFEAFCARLEDGMTP